MSFDPVTAAVVKAQLAQQPIVVSTLEVHGHSYGEGQSIKPNRWARKLARELGAREINRSVTGASISNHASQASWAKALQQITNVGNKRNRVSGPPYNLPGSDVVVLFEGINDLNTRDCRTDPTAANPIKEAFKTVISRYRAGAIREDTDSTVVASGGWSTASTTNPARNSGTSYKYSSANGDTVTITLPADFPAGATIAIGYTAEQGAGSVGTPGWGAVMAHTKNGVSAGSLDARNPTGGLGHLGLVHRITGCQPGDVIVATVGSIQTQINFDYWQVEAATETNSRVKAPLILVFGQPKLPSYTAYGSGLVTDAAVTNLNAAIQAACAAFDSSVVYIDMSAYDALRWFFSTSDDLHPSDEGHSEIGRIASRTIRQRAAVLPGYGAQINPADLGGLSNGQQGVICPTCRGWYHGNITLVAATAYAARCVVDRPIAVQNFVIDVITASSVNDPVEIAIYEVDPQGNVVQRYTTGAVTSKLNSIGIKQIPAPANTIVWPGFVYQVVVQAGTIGGTAPVLARADFTDAKNVQFWGSTALYLEGSNVAAQSAPLPGTLGTLAASGNTAIVGLSEV